MSATDDRARCAAPTCIALADGRRPFCAAHWSVLPGPQRSRVSLAMGFAWSPMRDETVRRAAASLPA